MAYDVMHCEYVREVVIWSLSFLPLPLPSLKKKSCCLYSPTLRGVKTKTRYKPLCVVVVRAVKVSCKQSNNVSSQMSSKFCS